jgi:signal transduction histidine kinase
MNSPVRALIRAALAALALCCAALPARAVDEAARVVILNGSDPYLPAYLVIDSAMRATLAAPGARPVVLFSETLDAQRFPVDTLEPEYLALLAKKYSQVRVDAVIAFSRVAFDFYIKHGERLWPGARLVYQGFGGGAVAPAVLPANARGVFAPEDVRGTIALARGLQPGARRMMVITGVADLDKRYQQLARNALAGDASGLAVEYLSGLPQPELLARVAAAAPDTIVLYLTQIRDRTGRAYVSPDLLREVSKASAAPVYGIAETFIGAGAVAGVAESLEDRGRMVAEQVLAALEPGPADPARAVLLSPLRCIADARALKRWALDEGRLPPNCSVRFAERSFWQEYFWVGLASLGVIAAQSMLIAALLVQMRRRRTAETESRQRFGEMAHMNRRVALGEMSASMAHELNQPLGAILNNASAAELLLMKDPPRLRDVEEILEDIKRDDQRASDIISRIRKMLVKAEFELRDVDLNAIVEETVTLLAGEAAHRGVAVTSEPEAGLPRVRADPTEVKQVIVNLALNAMDAMRGLPRMQRQLTIGSRRAGTGEAEVAVRDSGPGIPPELLPRIFDPFVTSKEGGMGLGLAISRTIIQTHGGSMRARNGRQGGAVVSFTLPLAGMQAP